MLDTDASGLLQGFELGLARELPAYVHARSVPFMARFEGKGVKATAPDLHDYTSSSVDVPGFGVLQCFNFWGDDRVGDEFGEITTCNISQAESGHPFLLELRGYFRVMPYQLRGAAREGDTSMGMVEVAPLSWWTADCPVAKHPNGSPAIWLRLMPTNDPGYLDMPALSDLMFRVADIELLKATREATVNVGAEKPLDTRERTTLLAIIGALAEPAQVDLNKPHKAGEAIAAMLDAKGVKVSARAIGEHLKAVHEAMNRRKT